MPATWPCSLLHVAHKGNKTRGKWDLRQHGQQTNALTRVRTAHPIPLPHLAALVVRGTHRLPRQITRAHYG